MKTKLAALAGVITGIALLLIGGGGPPEWLSRCLALVFSGMALLYGFTAFTPSAPTWLSSRPVMGIAAVYVGVAVMLVPANIVTSAFFMGIGIRLLMSEKPALTSRVVKPTAGDIVLRESGQMVPRN